MEQKLIIIGAGGYGKCCLDIARESDKYEEIVFLDDRELGKTVNNISVVGTISDLENMSKDYEVFVAIGNNEFRKEILQKVEDLGFHVATLISERCVVSPYAHVGKGSVVFPGVVIETNASVGEGGIVTANVVLNHDAKVQDYVLIYSNTVIRPKAVVECLSRIGSQCVITVGKKVDERSDIQDGERV